MNATQQQTIEQIASKSTNRREFLEGFIDHAIHEYDVLGGMFWDCTEKIPKPICQSYRGEQQMLKLGCSASQHNDFLRQAVASKEPLIVSADNETPGSVVKELHPTILMVSIAHGGRTEVAELFFAGDQPREQVTGKVGSLSSLSRAAAVWGMPPQRATQAPSSEPATRIDIAATEAFIHSLHQSLDLKDNARTIANETRRYLDCDRATVVQMRGRRCRTIAVSGQPSMNRRSNAVRLLEKVANKVLPTRQLFWYPDEDSLPPQIQNPLQEYLANSATRTMVVVPVFDKADSSQMEVDSHREKRQLIGGIVVEHCREQWDRQQQASVVELATRHGSDAFRNSWNHQSLFLYSIWKWLGKSKIIFAARHLPKTIAAVIGLVAACLALTLIQSDFQLSCDGSLIPEQRELVFSKGTGIVSKVLVQHGQDVKSGDPIVKLTDLDLDYQLTELEGQIKEVEQSIRSIESSRLGRKRGEEESLQQENLKSQQAELASLQQQQRIYLKRKADLVVTSPLSGQVMTWDVRKRLQNRTVSAMDQLMEIANVDGKWTLELDLPDRKVGHFMKRWNEAKTNDEPVDVEFILAAEPGVTHTGQVKAVGTSTQLNAANEHHLKILVDIDIESIDVRQSRSGVSAKIDCGDASLGYVWFHPVKEFFQAKVLFPIW
ncbi:GAF domain-containing protein [Mariniblastus fucicola]|uniref:HlyD family secretion protein n=1 Tax=Mariniblastus fucicola TaxID=980251 RepID=A0A5B9P963_9BACT|nr:GAF domain-containing protein [Mariniblastus fucicola]QEG21176.1 HlyD family secretion protein [Mariniblastus fucicola]